MISPQWTLHWKSPVMESHWTFPEYTGKLLRLVTFTNCESVELILNGESYGQRRLADYPDHLMVWHIPYIPGKIRAIGRFGENKVYEHELVTAGKPHHLMLNADRTVLPADGSAISHVEVTVVDEQGVQVPDHTFDLTFDIQGEGSLVGVDNGDLRSDEPYKGNHRKTQHGRCLAIVQSKLQAGEVKLLVSADGLIEGSVNLIIKA